MKILFLTNNEVTSPLIQWLRKKEKEVVEYNEKLSLLIINEYKPDFIISYNYKYIIGLEVIRLYPKKIINLHISLLPWNRGAFPIFWAVINNTPFGVTIHNIDEGIDTGGILFQHRLGLNYENETLSSAYTKHHLEIQKLFKKNWHHIRSGDSKPMKQMEYNGATKKIKDFEEYKKRIHNFTWEITLKELKDKSVLTKNENF